VVHVISEDAAWLKILPAEQDGPRTFPEIAGKWLCFCPKETLHSYIEIINKLVDEGTFKAAKFAKADFGSASCARQETVLCIYTSDDPDERQLVYDNLREIGLHPRRWKSDIETLLDRR
jgi:hypothetical protein